MNFIFVNGMRFWIRQNLHDALYTIRASESIVRIWTDAICINQDDNVEKSGQVRRMGHLYSQAEETLTGWASEMTAHTGSKTSAILVKTWEVFLKKTFRRIRQLYAMSSVGHGSAACGFFKGPFSHGGERFCSVMKAAILRIFLSFP